MISLSKDESSLLTENVDWGKKMIDNQWRKLIDEECWLMNNVDRWTMHYVFSVTG